MLPDSVKDSIILWLEEHRSFVVAVFCLPASFLFTVFLRLKAWLRTYSSRDHHDSVRDIQARVRDNTISTGVFSASYLEQKIID